MPTDIIIDQKPATKTKRRCGKIIINNEVEFSQKSIDFRRQNVELLEDGTPTGRVEEVAGFSELVSNLVTKTYSIADPVTGLTTPISGAAVSLWLESFYIERELELR